MPCRYWELMKESENQNPLLAQLRLSTGSILFLVERTVSTVSMMNKASAAKAAAQQHNTKGGILACHILTEDRIFLSVSDCGKRESLP